MSFDGGLPVGFKQTEIGPIPNDWDLFSLDEISQDTAPIRYGVVQIGPDTMGGVPIVPIKYINSIESSQLHRARHAIEERYSGSRIRGGDVLISVKGTIGEVGVVPKGFVGNIAREIARVRPKTDFISDFVAFQLASGQTQKRILDVTVGTTRMEFSIAAVREFKIAVPKDESEQRAITEALSDVDGLIVQLEALVAKKRDIKQAATQALLSGETRLPGFSSHWREVALGGISRIVRGASPRPIASPRWFDKRSKVGWLRISDVSATSRYLRRTTQALSEAGIENSRLVPSGSLVMSICATVGRPVITQIDVCIHDGFVVFENLNANQNFMYYLLSALEPEWSMQGQTGSQMNLNTGLIGSKEIKLPNIEEQTAIAAVLSDMDAEIEALKAQLAKTRDLKTGMMQNLLTGRVRLTATGERCAA